PPSWLTWWPRAPPAVKWGEGFTSGLGGRRTHSCTAASSANPYRAKRSRTGWHFSSSTRRFDVSTRECCSRPPTATWALSWDWVFRPSEEARSTTPIQLDTRRSLTDYASWPSTTVVATNPRTRCRAASGSSRNGERVKAENYFNANR